MSEYLYISPRIDGASILTTDALSDTTERHHVVLGTSDQWTDADPLEAVTRRNDIDGVVIGLTSGILDRARLQIVQAALNRGLPAWLYWAAEQAVERVDRERLQSLSRHRRAVGRDGAARAARCTS